MHLDCQNSVSSELICILSCNFQRILKGEEQLTKRQFVHTNTNNTATFTNSTITTAPTTTSIATTCKIKSIKRKLQEVYEHTGY